MRQTAQTLLISPRWRVEEMVDPTKDPSFAAHGVVVCEGQVPPGFEDQMSPAECLCLTAEGGLSARYVAYAEELLAFAQRMVARVTSGTMLVQLVVPAHGEGAVLQGLAGLLRSACREYPILVAQLVLVEDWSGLATRLRSEVGSVVCYTQSGREVHDWVEQPSSEVALPWRGGGVYWITGGLGGLGGIFAEAIVRQVEAPVVVLSGRRLLEPSQEKWLEGLRALGATVEYRAIAVNDDSGMSSLVQDILSRYGQLNGVIHSAGVLRDRLLANKTKTDLREVLGPKVWGLSALDEATREVPLDWLVLCSSVASVWGNQGQADYAAANGFLDGYASYREDLTARGLRHGRTVSISWPLWADGGMQVAASVRERLRRLTGLEPLPSEVGVDMLGRALAQTSAHMMVLHGDRACLLKTLQTAQGVAISGPITQRGRLRPRRQISTEKRASRH